MDSVVRETEVNIDCPYVGLFAFDEAHARYFFGRDGDAELIAANVLSAGVMILHGPSGVGKSSVLGAALPKALDRILPDALILSFRRWDPGFYNPLLQEAEARRAGAFALFQSRRREAADYDEVAEEPYVGLGEGRAPSLDHNAPAGALAEAGSADAGSARDHPHLVVEGPQPQALERVAQQWAKEVGTPSVFVFDQFEQYFTGQDFGSTTEDDQFEADVARIIKRRDLGCHVLISIREDALFELNRLRARIPNILARSLKLDYLDRAAAEEAINGPLSVWRAEKGESAGPTSAAPDLVESLISQVSRPGDVTRIETPYLQLALKRLWQQEWQQRSPELRRKTLDELRGAGGIAESHFKDTMKALPEDEQRLCAVIFDRMVTPSGMKIALPAADLAAMTGEDQDQVSGVLGKLAAGRSLIIHKVPPPQEGRAPLFEIFHDVLARPILSWIAAERERVRQERRLAEQRRAAEEERKKQQEELEQQRAEAEREQERHQQEVARQQQQIAREKHLKHRYLNLFLATGVLAVAAIGAAGYAVLTHREAAATRGRMLSSQARSELGDGDGRASLLLSLAALPERPGLLDDVFWPEREAAMQALDQAMATPLGASLPSSSGRLILATVGVHGRVVTTSETGSVHVWDDGALASRWNGIGDAPPRVLKHDKSVEVASASLDQTGELLLTADFDGGVYVWHASTGERWASWRPHDRPTTAALATDGTLIATASYGDVHPRLWASDPHNPEAAPIEKAVTWGASHKTGVTALAFDAGSDRLVSTSFDGTARVWRTCDGALLHSFNHGGAALLAAAFSPDGRKLITGSWDGTARLWALPPSSTARGAACERARRLSPPEQSKPLMVLRHDARVTSVAFDATGRQIVTAALDGAARIWDASSGALLRRLQGPQEVGGRFASAAISPDGTILATFMQRRAYLWPLKPQADLPKVREMPARPLAVTASADRQRIAVADESGIEVFDAASGDILRSISLEKPPLSVAMSPGGVFVAAAIGTRVGIWSADGDAPAYRELPDHGSLVLSVAYDKFGQRLLTSGQDGSVRLWKSTGQPLFDGKPLFPAREGSPAGKAPPVFAAVFASGGSEVVAGSFDGWLRVADATSGKELRAREVDVGHPILGMSVSGDDRHVIVHALADKEERRDDPPAVEHAFSVIPIILEAAAGHPLLPIPGDRLNSLELLQFGNAVEVTNQQGARNTVVVPFDRRPRLAPLPPKDPSDRVVYARQVKLSTLPLPLRDLSEQEQRERGLSSTRY